MKKTLDDLVWCCAQIETGVRICSFKRRSEIEKNGRTNGRLWPLFDQDYRNHGQMQALEMPSDHQDDRQIRILIPSNNDSKINVKEGIPV